MMPIKKFKSITLLVLFLISTSCMVKKYDLSGTELIFNDLSEISTSPRLSGTPVAISPSQAIDSWIYGDQNAEHPYINYQFGGEFVIKKEISLGSRFKSFYGYINSPIVHERKLIISNSKGVVQCFDIADNYKLLWKANLGKLGIEKKSIVSVSLSYGDDKVFAVVNNGFIVALDFRNGKLSWLQNLKLPLRSTFKYGDGSIYGVSLNGSVFAIDAQNGSVRWNKSASESKKVNISSPPVLIYKDNIVAGFASGELYSLSKKDGSLLWLADVSAKENAAIFEMTDIGSAPIDLGGVIMVGSMTGNIYFIENASGKVLQYYNGSIASNVTVSGEYAFFIDKMSRLICLHIGSSEVKWLKKLDQYKSFKTPPYINDGEHFMKIKVIHGGPIMIDGNLVIVSPFGKIIIVDPQDGSTKAEKDIPNIVHKYPVVSGGKIYLVDDYRGKLLIME